MKEIKRRKVESETQLNKTDKKTKKRKCVILWNQWHGRKLSHLGLKLSPIDDKRLTLLWLGHRTGATLWICMAIIALIRFLLWFCVWKLPTFSPCFIINDICLKTSTLKLICIDITCTEARTRMQCNSVHEGNHERWNKSLPTFLFSLCLNASSLSYLNARQ